MKSVFNTRSRVCPFCNEVHSVVSPHLNIICGCGGKYYANTGDWLNRKTGEKVKGLHNGCGQCSHCVQFQRQTNLRETGFNCTSYGFTVYILESLLDCEDLTLTQEQREAMRISIETVRNIDKTFGE